MYLYYTFERLLHCTQDCIGSKLGSETSLDLTAQVVLSGLRDQETPKGAGAPSNFSDGVKALRLGQCPVVAVHNLSQGSMQPAVLSLLQQLCETWTWAAFGPSVRQGILPSISISPYFIRFRHISPRSGESGAYVEAKPKQMAADFPRRHNQDLGTLARRAAGGPW